MLNKKSVRILSIVLLAVVLFVSFANVAFAVEVPTPSDVTVDGDVKTTIETVLGIIKYAGILAAVVMAMYIGIKYITSSPEGKAEVKKTLAYYIGGMVLLLSASGIVGMIQTNFTIK